MGDVIQLSNVPIDLNSDVGHRFVVDATRAGEGLMTDKELREKYELSPADWRNITESTALGRAVRAERERRMLDGTAARESAARHLVKGPGILDEIMTGAQSHPKHKIEALRGYRRWSGPSSRPACSYQKERARRGSKLHQERAH
jgi:hypothetical protein